MTQKSRREQWAVNFDDYQMEQKNLFLKGFSLAPRDGLEPPTQ